MLRPTHAGHDEVDAIDPLGVDLGEHSREEVGLLLVVAFEDHAIARADEGLEHFHDGVGLEDRSLGEVADHREATALLGSPPVPPRIGLGAGLHVVSVSVGFVLTAR